MSVIIKGALIGAMIFGSSPVAMVREAASSHVPDRACGAVQIACLPWQAQIDRRQSGAAELPDNFTLPPSDLALEALDRPSTRS